jgi:long-chain acyl-CoA synthetase
MRDVTTIAEDMANVAPTFLIAVPRVFNKIYDGLQAKINETGGLAKKLFEMGLQSAEQNRRLAEQGNRAWLPRMKYKLADRIVYNKIRAKFGGRLKGAMTASAMMNPVTSQFFADIGMPVFDAYGLTETSPAVTINNREFYKRGSVGRPIDKVRVVTDKSVTEDGGEEGEIVVYGPNVMHGYFNNPEATREVMTEDGGFRTGDLGRLDKDGYLYITGRIKEQYKLENGKYVFPATIEEEIQLSPWVENVLVFGESRACNVCLIVPDFEALKTWAQNHGHDPAPSALIRNPVAKEMIGSAIQKQLKGKFGSDEIPKSVVLVAEGLSVENGMLTQTLKLKRRKVIEHFSDKIEEAYTTV